MTFCAVLSNRMRRVNLFALWLALHGEATLVVLGRDTGDGLDLGLLHFSLSVSLCECNSRTTNTTNLEVLVACFLVFPVHGAWGALGKVAGKAEDDACSGNTEHGVGEDLGAFTWRRKGAGTVGSKSNPVSCAIGVSVVI